MQDQTITVLLAGGVGSRRHPRTAERAKPAVPFGGRFRIIDFASGAPIDRCIVDKQATIPPGERISQDSYCDVKRFVTSDGGIVVVPWDGRFNPLAAPEKPKRLFEPPIVFGRKATA